MIAIAGTAIGAVKVPECRAIEPDCASRLFPFLVSECKVKEKYSRLTAKG